ncbi:helix-turn-helix domain-containing protein [Streptomyces sp. NPDC059788]|uniref:helix-turn-helix domain-containing protein n=1 Tax=Streptomyces sp. NPDC059788 TaxID=3346948 RepID=UPI003649F90B
MARPEKPLGMKSPLVELAAYLREGRRSSRLTYSELAGRAGVVSATTLQRAASGQRLPRRDVVRAYAHACRLDIKYVDRLWEAAYHEKQRLTRGAPPPPAIPPKLVNSLADLSSALVALHAKKGAPSIRLMQYRARQHATECTPLSTSTLHRILNRAAVPTSKGRLDAFLIGCEVSPEQRSLWERAAARARRRHRMETEQIRHAMADLEAQLAEGAQERLSADRAAQLLREADFDPTEPYHGFNAPWTARCRKCRRIQRVRLSTVTQERGGCRNCRG